jgi:NADP-reducing hydrogenase subunit HndB
MKSLAELEAIRERALKEINLRDNADKTRIVVGMATCGIAAGARPVMNAFVEELDKRKMQDVNVTMTGCVGACRLEPMADVITAQGEKTTYVNLNPEKVRRIVVEHLINGRPVIEYTIGEAEK